MGWLRRLGSTIVGKRLERTLDEEMRFHVDERTDEYVRAGMTRDDVLSRIGRPATTWPIAYQRQIVWSYRYESPFCQWFMVGMGQEGKVVDTAYGPDPLCEPDDFFTRLRSRR